MLYIELCLLRLKQHVTNEKKNTRNISKMLKLFKCWNHMYSILSTFLFLPVCYFYDLSERSQFNKEQNQSLTNIDTNSIHLLFSIC